MSIVDEFTPKTITVFREGYGAADLRADALAGLTVAIVALPLSMAIAIASGVGPERGLYTAIIGGFLVSALGGSRFQIGGPAGAFIVLVSACVMQIGVPGLILATFLSGFILMAVGALRLGSYVKFIPYPVTVGFTAGIAVIILASQVRDLFGLTLPGAEPAEIVHKVQALWAARGTVTPAALGLAVATIAIIQGLKRWRPHWPGMLIAIAATALAAWALALPVDTIGSRFGALPRTPPAPQLPQMDHALLLAALPYAVSFALLGAIESLLSAVVADGMSGRRHRSNAELVAQGAANIGSALFGGFCVTGTIARTATNVRAGSRGPVSGMLHALFVLLVLLVAAPLAGFIPLAALAGVLAVVAWNMAEKAEFWALVRASRADAAIVLVTFLLVVFRDLTEGIVAGAAIGGAVFIRRMSEAARVEPDAPETPVLQSGDAIVYRLHGAYFFGAAATVGAVLDSIADRPGAFILDFSDVPFVDSSGARSFELLARKMERTGGHLVLTGASPEVRRNLLAQGLREPHVRWRASVTDALAEFSAPAG
ncbi:SulP family inorganic anion transporter [Gemmobacter sp.]|uniref:SulP family inorganic anion transporter n=1 Tax=Gemmobacter sp. TaxID=1898957 RepID=UPI002AFE022D|nr:SulP family inorganic anion transporter [Gemmobacter sp.]